MYVHGQWFQKPSINFGIVLRGCVCKHVHGGTPHAAIRIKHRSLLGMLIRDSLRLQWRTNLGFALTKPAPSPFSRGNSLVPNPVRNKKMKFYYHAYRINWLLIGFLTMIFSFLSYSWVMGAQQVYQKKLKTPFWAQCFDSIVSCRFFHSDVHIVVTLLNMNIAVTTLSVVTAVTH